jgi:hypothetical protein
MALASASPFGGVGTFPRVQGAHNEMVDEPGEPRGGTPRGHPWMWRWEEQAFAPPLALLNTPLAAITASLLCLWEPFDLRYYEPAPARGLVRNPLITKRQWDWDEGPGLTWAPKRLRPGKWWTQQRLHTLIREWERTGSLIPGPYHSPGTERPPVATRHGRAETGDERREQFDL